MLTLKEVTDAQMRYGVGARTVQEEQLSYEIYLDRCRKALTDRTTMSYYSMTKEDKNAMTDRIIYEFVTGNKVKVEGFVDETGELKVNDLIKRLTTDIVDFGILRSALEDETIQEIQINDYKSIWVMRGGKTELYTDKNGRPYQFVSDKELISTFDRLLYSSEGGSVGRMTQANPLLNARTAEKGYRVSSVYNTATTRDLLYPDIPVTTITIRKYSQTRMGFDTFVNKYESMTAEMARFLRLAGRSTMRVAFVGATGSGKTTLLNAMAWEIPKERRIILIQNPTEIMIYERSPETHVNLRNTVHWEATDLGGELRNDPTTGTMENMMAHTLRNGPEIIILGESRTPGEFFQLNRAASTGTIVYATWHALNGPDAIKRMSEELSTMGGSVVDHARSVAGTFDLIVSQARLNDGTRRIMKIEEMEGTVDDGLRARSRVLYEFKPTKQVDKNPDGSIKLIHGVFKRRDVMSDRLAEKFYLAGVSDEELAEFLRPVDEAEVWPVGQIKGGNL